MISEGSMHQYGSKHLGIWSMSLSLKPPEVAVGLGAAVTSARTRSHSFQQLRMFSQLSLFLLSLAFLLQQRMTLRRSKKASRNFARVVRQAEASSVSVHRDVTAFPMFLPLIVGWEFSTKNKKRTCCLRAACCAQETELMVMAGSVPKVLAIRCN